VTVLSWTSGARWPGRLQNSGRDWLLVPRTWIGHHERASRGTGGSPSPTPIHKLSTLCGDRPHRPAPTVAPVSQTPIYDQLRDQRIIDNAQATGASPQRVSRSARHRLPDGAAGVAARSGGSAQRVADTRLPVCAAQPGPPPDSEQETTAVRGPQAAVAPPAHARQAHTQHGSGSPEPDTGHSRATLKRRAAK
jgi:hypothetical protein